MKLEETPAKPEISRLGKPSVGVNKPNTMSTASCQSFNFCAHSITIYLRTILYSATAAFLVSNGHQCEAATAKIAKDRVVQGLATPTVHKSSPGITVVQLQDKKPARAANGPGEDTTTTGELTHNSQSAVNYTSSTQEIENALLSTP